MIIFITKKLNDTINIFNVNQHSHAINAIYLFICSNHFFSTLWWNNGQPIRFVLLVTWPELLWFIVFHKSITWWHVQTKLFSQVKVGKRDESQTVCGCWAAVFGVDSLLMNSTSTITISLRGSCCGKELQIKRLMTELFFSVFLFYKRHRGRECISIFIQPISLFPHWYE